MGAVATGGVRVLNPKVVAGLQIAAEAVDAVAQRELRELERRERLYRGGRPPPEVRGRTVILVDDGLATGATMRAAVQAMRQQHAARIVAAVPIASRDACEALRAEADDVICAMTPEPFLAVGQGYDDFTQTTDDEVCRLLAAQREAKATRPAAGAGNRRDLPRRKPSA
jgi:putative phosphoribosyl transferase